jgi:hypothetical protein
MERKTIHPKHIRSVSCIYAVIDLHPREEKTNILLGIDKLYSLGAKGHNI